MNCTTAEYLFAATAALFAVISAIGAWQSIELVTLLRLRHPVTWDLLGRPDGTSNADDTGNAAAMLQFLWRREHVKLDDRQLSVSCERARWAGLLSFSALVGALVCLAATPSLERAMSFACWRLA